ncbi:hypothetical protein [Pseudomonas sp. Irchel 3E13]|uniref:hypothetical protein n=1 Tax=Pseudomonas sp. Irchel 3E13 TaxID=2008975 RepID=UPI0015AD2C04|nr:hypothetical protein [Pseudomonas sp. Irchel 3E13]
MTTSNPVPPYIGRVPLVGGFYAAGCTLCGWVGSSEELTDDCQCTRSVGDRYCLGDTDEIGTERLLAIIQAMAELKQDATRFRFIVDCPIREAVAISRKANDPTFDLTAECDRLIEKTAFTSSSA